MHLFWWLASICLSYQLNLVFPRRRSKYSYITYQPQSPWSNFPLFVTQSDILQPGTPFPYLYCFYLLCESLLFFSLQKLLFMCRFPPLGRLVNCVFTGRRTWIPNTTKEITWEQQGILQKSKFLFVMSHMLICWNTFR
jgi:hypothetical protein